MISLLIIVLLFLICFVLLQNIQLGFAMVIAVDFFFVRAVSLMGVLPLRELFMVVTWFFFLYHGLVKNEYKLTFDGVYKKPIIIFFFIIFIILFFSTGEAGILVQLKHIFGLIYYISYAYIAYTIYNNEKGIVLFSKIMIFSAFVMTLYGLFCYLTTSNPYLSILENLTGKKIIGGLEMERGGLTGRVQSTMSHPLTWAGCCGLLLLFFLEDFAKIKSILKYLLISLLGINIFLSGSRSAILALFVGLIFLFIWKKKNMKMILSLIFVAILLISAIYLIPPLQQYKGLFESTIFFWDENIAKSNEMKGSTIYLRQMQLLGSLEMIDGNFLFGLGHGYVDYYVSNNGPHPILFGFESLVYNKLVEGGLIDLLLWFFVFFTLFNSVKKINKRLQTKQDISILKTYVVFFFVYSLLTGFMQAFLCFIIIYVVLIKGIIIKGNKVETIK